MSDVHFDFSAALVIATLVTGVIWGLDVAIWSRRRLRDDKLPAAIDFSRSFFPIILIVLLLRSFVVEPFRIPSGSMLPTLLVGDFILVNKFAYGLRLPVLHTRFVDLGEPQRGDVAVFRYPVDPATDFIKRIVGLPGDVIEYRDKRLFVNGEPVRLESRGVYTTRTGSRAGYARRFTEALGEVEHDILIRPEIPPANGRYVVPDGHYFVMGDNRDGSHDSRRWGTVPERNLVGRAFMIWMSWDGNNTRISTERIGMKIR